MGKKGRVNTRRKQILQLDDSKKSEKKRGKKSHTRCEAYMFAEDDKRPLFSFSGSRGLDYNQPLSQVGKSKVLLVEVVCLR